MAKLRLVKVRALFCMSATKKIGRAGWCALMGYVIANFMQLFVESGSNVDCASHGATYHRVVADAEEAHHFDVCRN